MGPIRGVSLICKSMIRAVFASVMGKFGSPKNKLPLPAPFDSAYALLDLDSPRMWEAVI